MKGLIWERVITEAQIPMELKSIMIMTWRHTTKIPTIHPALLKSTEVGCEKKSRRRSINNIYHPGYFHGDIGGLRFR